jgi:hypothetical protein
LCINYGVGAWMVPPGWGAVWPAWCPLLRHHRLTSQANVVLTRKSSQATAQEANRTKQVVWTTTWLVCIEHEQKAGLNCLCSHSCSPLLPWWKTPKPLKGLHLSCHLGKLECPWLAKFQWWVSNGGGTSIPLQGEAVRRENGRVPKQSLPNTFLPRRSPLWKSVIRDVLDFRVKNLMINAEV